LDNNGDQLVDRINKFIRNKSAFDQTPAKRRFILKNAAEPKQTKPRLIFKLNERKRNNELIMNSKTIGLICLPLNEKIEKDVWLSGNIEELVQKICKNFV
jgi:hypothetical protein